MILQALTKLYEDLVKHVPKNGAFVQTEDGYGNVTLVNLLRQSVKVRLDGDNDDTLHVYKANELCTVPGGRPRDGSEPPHVLHYVPEPEEEETEDEWQAQFEGYCGMGSAASDRYYIPLPVWAGGNVYFGGATPWDKEIGPVVREAGGKVAAVETGDGWVVETDVTDFLPEKAPRAIDTEALGMAFEPEEQYENPDGSPIDLGDDYRACFTGWTVRKA